jgi:hypothetical protein
MSQKPSQRLRTYKRTFDDDIHRVLETIKAPTRADAQELRERMCLAVDSLERLIAEASAGVEHPWSDANRDLATLKNAILSKLAPAGNLPHESQLLAVWAFRMGELLTDAKWRSSQGDRVRRSIKRKRQTSAAGKQPKETKYARDNQRLDTAILAYLDKHSLATAGMIAARLHPWYVEGTVTSKQAFEKRVRRRLVVLGR